MSQARWVGAQAAGINAITAAQLLEHITEQLAEAEKRADKLLEHEPSSRPGQDCKHWWIPKIRQVAPKGRTSVYRFPLCFRLPNDDVYLHALGELLGPSFTVKRESIENDVWVQVYW